MSAENGTMESPRRLSPLVAGAAVAVMLFSLVGIAAITGMLPGALSQKSADVAPGAPAEPKVAACAVCGTVDSIRPVEVRGDPTGLGAVAGGAYAGNEIEKNMNKRLVYRVTVRMDDGSYRTVSQATAPAFAVGDKVRVVQGALRAAKS